MIQARTNLHGKSASKRLRAAVEYDKNPPRCRTCVYFVNETYTLQDSLPTWFGAACKRYLFRCEAGGVCNAWKGRDGSELMG